MFLTNHKYPMSTNKNLYHRAAKKQRPSISGSRRWFVVVVFVFVVCVIVVVVAVAVAVVVVVSTTTTTTTTKTKVETTYSDKQQIHINNCC